jgi:DNA-binding MarR family transcriptional regulator
MDREYRTGPPDESADAWRTDLLYNRLVMDSCLGLCNAIKSAANTLDRQLNAALTGLDISHCQSLVVLELGNGRASVSHLSKVLCCSCGNISQIVDLLEKKGMVERVQSTEDRRRAELTLTPKGRKLSAQAKQALSQRAGHCCSVFSAAEKAELKRMLEKYAAAAAA